MSKSIDPVIVDLLRSELHRRDTFVGSTVIQIGVAEKQLSVLQDRLSKVTEDRAVLESFILSLGLDPDQMRKDCQ